MVLQKAGASCFCIGQAAAPYSKIFRVIGSLSPGTLTEVLDESKHPDLMRIISMRWAVGRRTGRVGVADVSFEEMTNLYDLIISKM